MYTCVLYSNGKKEVGDVPMTANGSSASATEKGGEVALAADSAAAAPTGQLVEVKFRAPKAGKYDLTLYCISGMCADLVPKRKAAVAKKLRERSFLPVCRFSCNG